jgi:hypothetical protein
VPNDDGSEIERDELREQIERDELRRERDEEPEIERAGFRRLILNLVIYVAVLLGLVFLAMEATHYWRGTGAG